MAHVGWAAPLRAAQAEQGPRETFTLSGVARLLTDDRATERWSRSLPFSLQNRVVSDSGAIFASNHEGSVMRFNPENGKPLWTFRPGGTRMFSDPSFTPEGDLLVVGDMRHVYVLDRESGQQKLKLDLDSGTLSPPAAGPNGTVVLLGGDGLMNQKWSIYAVDPEEQPRPNLLKSLLSRVLPMPYGTEHKWEVPVNHTPNKTLPIPMTPKGELHRLVPYQTNHLVAVTGESEVTAVNTETGALAFSTRIPAHGLFDPVPTREHLVVASNTRLFYLTHEGEIERTEPIDGVIFSQPTADAEGNVYLFTGIDKLHAIRRDGTRWEHRGRFETGVQPVSDGQGNLYVLKEGALHSLDAATGEENYRLLVPEGQVSQAPSLLPDGSMLIKIRDEMHNERLVSLKSPLEVAAQPEETAAVQEGVSWVQLGGVRVKKKKTL